MEHDRDKSPTGTPSLEQMTSTALQLLMKSKAGFLLVVSWSENINLSTEYLPKSIIP
jgi:Alkaline phosphatase